MAETPNYFKMLTDFWEGAGKTTSEAQKSFMEEMRGRIGTGFPLPFPPSDANTTKATETFAQLLKSLMVLPGEVANAAGKSGLADAKTTELLQKIMNPQEWLTATGYTDRTVQQLVEGPKFADIGQFEGKLALLFKTWNELRSLGLQQNTYQLSAWSKAVQEFTPSLAKEAEKRSVDSKVQIVALWVDIANRQMFELQRSPEYLKNQRELLRASTAFKRAQTDLSDYFGEALGIPTRSEIDDLTKTVADLKREIRTSQRQRKRASMAQGKGS